MKQMQAKRSKAHSFFNDYRSEQEICRCNSEPCTLNPSNGIELSDFVKHPREQKVTALKNAKALHVLGFRIGD